MLRGIISYEHIEPIEDGHTQVTDAEFLKNFGVWKKGDKVGFLSLDMNDMKLTEWTAEGDKVKDCSVELVAVWSKCPECRHSERADGVHCSARNCNCVCGG